MAWNPKGGGGGPWGGGGGQGPWGGGSGGGGGQRPPGGSPPPDIEEMLKRSQEQIRKFMPGRFGGGKLIPLAILLIVAIWMATGFYRVQPGQQGVELMFGKFVKLTSPGLNYWLPSPLGDVIVPEVTRVNTIQIGFRSSGGLGAGTGRGNELQKESLMLTGDQNIVDLDFVVQWKIKNAADYLFNIRNPEETVKVAAESAMREVIGQRPLDDALTQKKVEIEVATEELLQRILDDYGSGVLIDDLKLQQADPPQDVIDAFNDVQRARQDQDRFINEATAYSNDILPRARGEAQRMIEEARAYKSKVVAEAEGEAQRFISVMTAYRGNPEVTKRRLYLERMQDILQRSDKIIIDQTGSAGGTGVVPYLPLNELRKNSQ